MNAPSSSIFRVLVNALSVTNQSGAHVLLGHLEGLAAPLAGRCRFTVLCRESMKDFRARLGASVDWVFAPAPTSHWFRRSIWELRHLSSVVRQTGARAYFTPSGLAAPSLSVPQIVFCQNPWALVASARRMRDAPKAWLQRLGYRRAMRVAGVMVFNSRYMREAYRRNAGFSEKRGLVVYQAADEATRLRAAAHAGAARIPGQIVCVSAMGPHKNVETVLRAVRLLRDRGHSGLRLHLVGAWPDPAYQVRIQSRVRELDLADHVVFKGFVPREELDRCFAESRVFCLMSRCESFGIPAIEAQLFGTPVVSSNVCAIPEICGGGGEYCDPDDAPGVAEALNRLLVDDERWRRHSRMARDNAARFSWPVCTRPLRDLFEELAGHA